MREFFYNINYGQIHLDMVSFFAYILIPVCIPLSENMNNHDNDRSIV